MNSKNPGEGLHILWEIISKGIEYRWEQFKDWAFSPNEDWRSKKEDYLSRHIVHCDDWHHDHKK